MLVNGIVWKAVPSAILISISLPLKTKCQTNDVTEKNQDSVVTPLQYYKPLTKVILVHYDKLENDDL
jgi:hypothetical protein